MKRSLLAVCMMASVAAFAQTQRLSLYEEFTGETCNPCAATNPGLNALLLTTSNQQKIVAIKWQVPIPSASIKPWSLYQTNKTEINWRHLGWNGNYGNTTINPPTANGYGYPSQNASTVTAIVSGVNSAPAGRIDGQHQWVFGASQDHPAVMTQAVIDAAYNTPAPFALNMVRAWDATASAVNLTVTITAAQNFTSVGALKFRCVMVEREISFDVQPGTNGEKFFEDVAIKSFPSIQAGTPLSSTWANAQTTTFTLNCPIPSYCRDKAQIAMVGFIQDDGDRKVHQVFRADKVAFPNDAKAVTVAMPSFECNTLFTPTLDLTNTGNNAITAMTITPILDGVNQSNILWTGTLPVGNTITVVGNPITPSTPGGHSITYSISGVSGGDMNQFNNSVYREFYLASAYPGGAVVETFSLTSFPAPTNGWMATNPDGGAAWSQNPTANGPSYSAGTGAIKYDFYDNYTTGDQDELIFPPVAFTLASTPKLTFDVAYRPYISENDRLEVKVSKDCGNTWTTVYNKSGASGSNSLATVPSGTAPYTPASPSEWRAESVSLSGFGNSNVIIKFVTTSDFGNNLYIDNVNLVQTCVTQTLVASAKKPVMCTKDNNTVTVTGAVGYQWAASNSSNTATGNAIVIPPQTNTGTITYTITSTDTDGCSNSTQITVTVSACTGLEQAALSGIAHEIFPNPNNGEFTLKGNFSGKTSTLVLYNNLGQKVFEQPVSAGENNIRTQLASGVYLYNIVEAGIIAGKGNLIVR